MSFVRPRNLVSFVRPRELMSFVRPRNLVSFVRPRELVSFDPRHVTRSPPILGFHVTSEKTKIKLKLKNLSFYLYRVKVIFKRIPAALSSAR